MPQQKTMNLSALWVNARTKRYHTLTTMKEQTVADHQWGVAAIIAYLHPSPSADLLKAAMFHDCAEAYTGDVPYTLKEIDPSLKATIDELEKTILEDEFDLKYNLSLDDANWLKSADMLELVLYCSHEIAQGNTIVAQTFLNGLNYLQEMKCPDPIKEIVNEIAKQGETL